MVKVQEKKLLVTLIKSVIGRSQRQRSCVQGLGLKKTNHSVILADTPENRGMINKVSFLLKVEEKNQ